MGTATSNAIRLSEKYQSRLTTNLAVACCYVEITGKDGTKHFLTTDAASAYDAVQQAINAWAMFWWWDSTAIATVKRSEESWNIPVRKVIEKQSARYRRGG